MKSFNPLRAINQAVWSLVCPVSHNRKANAVLASTSFSKGSVPLHLLGSDLGGLGHRIWSQR